MLRQYLANDPDVYAAILAHRFARKIGLPLGNYWEPGAARQIAKALRDNPDDWDQVEAHYHFRFFGEYP
jgi:hypothetical protein